MRSAPIFCRYGRARSLEEVLGIPTWEFFEFLEAIQQLKAEESIAMAQATGAGMNGDNDLIQQWYDRARRGLPEAAPRSGAIEPRSPEEQAAALKELQGMFAMLG